jgi:hypothetical protein
MQCPKCKGHRFEIHCLTCTCLSIDFTNDEFEVIDTRYGDTEWEDDDVVVCLDCGFETTISFCSGE